MKYEVIDDAGYYYLANSLNKAIAHADEVLSNGSYGIRIAPSKAFGHAVIFESESDIGIASKLKDGKYYGITEEEIIDWMTHVVYKVVYNLKNGHIMDERINPFSKNK